MAEDLIRALCAVSRDEATQAASSIVPLVSHPVPEVRAEALSALLVIGRMAQHRVEAVRALSGDTDEGVRAKAAYGIAATAGESTIREDVPMLLRALRNEHESPEVRRAVYEALELMFRRVDFPDSLAEFKPETDVDWEWIKEIELLYG